MYDLIASEWHKHRQKPFPFVVEWAKGKKGKTIDIGCGTGRHSKLFKDVVGVDISEKMLEYYPFHGVKADARSLPFDDESFDNAMLVAVLHHFKPKDQVKVLEEMYRVLKRRGKGIISVWYRKGKKEQIVSWGPAKRYYYFFTKSELESLVKSIGFNIERSYIYGKNIVVEVSK
ncbi:hypothetical protein DRN75_00685 [Nanoarchaeota archaeon]|nr:MAG: hypothetical protein DRN75_00685 [Nanoarchaeota archaeon]